MPNYKALQNKALHKGAYIAYGVDGAGHKYTTNGQIMVHAVITADEVKPLKDQHDYRDMNVPLNLGFIVDKCSQLLSRTPENVEEWTNNAGLQLTKCSYDEFEVSVQSVYIDYINARFSDVKWWMTPFAVFASDSTSHHLLAVIAPATQVTVEEKTKKKETIKKGEA